jgi:hypothetical protein
MFVYLREFSSVSLLLDSGIHTDSKKMCNKQKARRGGKNAEEEMLTQVQHTDTPCA